MEPSLKLLRTIRLALMASIVLYAIIGEIAGPPPRQPNSELFFVIAAVTVAMVGTNFVLRRAMIARPEAALANKPEDPPALGRWRAGHIVTFAVCEAIALYGLVLRFLGFSFSQVAPFYIAGFVLLLYFAPRRRVNTIG